MGSSRQKKSLNKREVSKILKINLKELSEFEREGIFSYLDKAKKTIDQDNFDRLKTAVALKTELGVNTPGIDIILNLVEKLEKVQGDFHLLLNHVRRRMGTRLNKNLVKIYGPRE